MFLKRISLCGFKSFSDKVDFDFGPGVTCIVGPNGCGKSNLVDALKWVLGEQSARSLRGRQMSDMIFNGSSTRRSSSVAQVDLTFDNADRTLSLDQDEITVTRKLYRSGESEYLLNRDVARLKDVRELFLDTGVGVDAYSIVEQGRVDSLLQSSPTERRIIFEEAAGISKYKVRRREAERKLERTQQNLLRVSDVIEELEKRIRSVKLQAGKARNYQAYEARLSELRSSFAMAEFHRFTRDVEKLEAQLRQHTDRVTEIRTAIDRQDAQEAELVSKLDRQAEEINAADAEFIQAKSEHLAHEERVESAGKRVVEQEELLERATGRHAMETRRLEESQRELAAMEESAEALQRQTQEIHERINELIQRDGALARDLTHAQAALDDEKAGIIELLRKSAQMHNEIVRLNTHRESLVGQKGRLCERDEAIAAELKVSLDQRTQLEGRIRQLDGVIAAQVRNLEEKKNEAARISEVRQRLVEELARTKEQRSALASRRELLEDLEQRMEGIGAAARELLELQRQDSPPAVVEHVIGLVADVFETDTAHAPLIEAALGDRAQDLVLAESRALVIHSSSFASLPGRLTTVCLDRLPPVVNERDFADQPGFVARALDLVRVSDDFDQLAHHLLGKTVVVDTLDAAFAMARTDVAGHRFVTGQGTVVEPDGRVSLGPASKVGGLISRKSELRDLEVQQAGVEKRIGTLDDQLNRTQAETDHLEVIQQELRTATYEANTAKVEAGAALQNVSESIDRFTREQPLIAQEVAMIEQQIDEVLAKSAQGGESLEAMERENAEREHQVEAHQQRIDAIVTDRVDVQEELTRTKVAAGQLTEKRAATTETINTLRRSIRELEASLAGADGEMDQCRARITDAKNTIEAGREHLATLSARIHRLEQNCSGLRHDRERLRLQSEDLSKAIRESRTQLEGAEAQVHEHDMALAEVKVRRDSLTARITEELGLDLAQRYAEYEHEDQDWEAIETEIAELRSKMDRLGSVNLDAIQELEELEERHGFLTAQRDDLQDSHTQLERLIRRLNDESRDRFKKTYDEIRENFRALFRKLFGGGRADIVLEDPENVLECGIEILAQPPGKELQAISLMSGGEKSLTAIALLMSIFQSRPAPFAILDEVDAALDEANNDRFNLIVQEFVSCAQFLVVTHSKWTMGIADQLYGVTMQEPGVSTRVSVELKGTNVA